MIEWLSALFQGAFAELVFLSICLGGLGISGFMIMFGGHGTDAGDGGDADVGHDGDVGGADHETDHGDEGPKFLSIRGLSLFGTGFGGVGYIVQHYTGKTLVAAVAGIIFGFILAMLGLAFIKVFYRQQVSSLISNDQIIGATGMILTSIPSDGRVGEVSIVAAGQQVVRTAMSSDGAEIQQGTVVHVLRLAGHVVVVEKVK